MSGKTKDSVESEVAAAPMSAKAAREFAKDMEALEGAIAFTKPSFEYKVPKNRKLHPDQRTWDFLENVSARRGTKKEAAALLGVKPNTLTDFFSRHPEAGEAWERGEQLHDYNLRLRLDMAAINDPTTLRFLAKNYLGMTDGNTNQTNIDVNITNNPEALEAKLELIKQLQGKVIDVTAEDVSDNRQIEDLSEIFNTGEKQ